MTAWQKLIRDKKAKENDGSFLLPPDNPDIKTATVKNISYATARNLILDYEWLGNMAQRTTDCYGIYFEGVIGGAVCFATPNTREAAMGVCGEECVDMVKVLARGACVHWAHPHSASKLIKRAIDLMVAETPFRIFLAYSDTRAGEIGTVYQATNWLYTGLTGGDVEYFIDGSWRGGRVARHDSYKRRGIDYRLQPKRDTQPKHRYVFIKGKNRHEQKELMSKLKYSVLPYPKREL